MALTASIFHLFLNTESVFVTFLRQDNAYRTKCIVFETSQQLKCDDRINEIKGQSQPNASRIHNTQKIRVESFGAVPEAYKDRLRSLIKWYKIYMDRLSLAAGRSAYSCGAAHRHYRHLCSCIPSQVFRDLHHRNHYYI